MTFNAPKSTLNAKLNFNYFTGIQKENEKPEKLGNKTFINPINFINNIKESKNNLKEENSSNSYFYDYGSNTIINTGIFNISSIKVNKAQYNVIFFCSILFILLFINDFFIIFLLLLFWIRPKLKEVKEIVLLFFLLFSWDFISNSNCFCGFIILGIILLLSFFI